MVMQRERKLVYQWITKYHYTKERWRNVRLGAIPEGKNPELYAGLRKYADAVFLEDDAIVVIEAKVIPKPDTIMQLIQYAKLAPDTPMFSKHKNKKVRMVYLSALEDTTIRDMCKEYGVEFVVFQPDWIKPYLREKGWRI